MNAGDRRVKMVTSTITEEWTNYCRAGGPGCIDAHPDRSCCGKGYWRNVASSAVEIAPASLFRSASGTDAA